MLWTPPSTAGQQSQIPGPSAPPFLHRSFATLTGGTRTKDVTLSGTATYYGGASAESGSITLTGVNVDQSQLTANLPSGTRSVTRTLSNGVSSETGAGPGGTFYTFGSQDLMTPAGWFFPVYIVAHGVASSGYASSFVGSETRNGATVVHLAIWQTNSTSTASSAQSLSTRDVYLDPVSFLPVAVAFSLPPSTNTTSNIPVEIRYSDYRPVQGRMVAFHVQAYVQAALLWDIQISSVSLNTGAVVGASS